MFPTHQDFIPRSTTILSVYPIRKTATMRHIGQTTYTMPPADKGLIRVAQPDWACKVFDFQKNLPPLVETPCNNGDGYSLLCIYDTFQSVTDPSTERPEDKPMMVEFVRQDLLRQWVSQSFGSNLGASGPGIIAIAGTTPTEEELARARAMQHEFFTALVMSARDLYTTGHAKEINNRHRMAGEYLGIQGEAWMQSIKPKTLKTCGSCGADIDHIAITCNSCSANLVKFYQEMIPYGITPESRGDHFVADILKRYAAANSVNTTVAPPAPEPPKSIKPPITGIAPPPKPEAVGARP